MSSSGGVEVGSKNLAWARVLWASLTLPLCLNLTVPHFTLHALVLIF